MKTKKIASKVVLSLAVALYTGLTCSSQLFHPFVLINEDKTFFKFLCVVTCVVVALRYNLIHINTYSIIFGCIYGLIMIAGKIYSLYDTLFISVSWNQFLGCFFQLTGYLVLFITIYSISFHIMNNIHSCVKAPNNQDKWNWRKNKKVYIVFALTLITYGSWLFVLRPNIATYDSANQISQAFGWIPLANNNPFLHTLLLRCILSPASSVLKDTIKSIFILEIISVLVFSIITTICIIFFEKNFEEKSIPIKALELFYFLNPLVGWYTVTLWKDIWISYFIILLYIFLYKALASGTNRMIYLELAVVSFLVLSFKGTGLLYIGTLIIALICQARKKTKRNCILVAWPMLIAVAAYCGITFYAYNYLNVEKHFAGDTQSVIWQTLARTAKYRSLEMSEEDLSELNCIIDVEKASQLYNSKISDPIKGYCLNYNYFEDNTKKSLYTWLKLGYKFPKEYIDAIFGSGYGYYYPDVQYWVFSAENYLIVLQKKAFQELLKDPYLNTYDINYSVKRFDTVSNLKSELEYLRKWPLVGRFSSIGVYFMLYFFLLLYSKERKIDNRGVLISVPIAIFVSCILSPVYAEMRYAYPAILSLPIFIAIVSLQVMTNG